LLDTNGEVQPQGKQTQQVDGMDDLYARITSHKISSGKIKQIFQKAANEQSVIFLA
jgi:hypothetical protein